ncbi:MAG: hypothetical protein ABJC04_08795 [Verrucomicrobiota bacterium]
MKTTLIFLIVMELFLVLLLGSPICIKKRSATVAFVEWRNNPTPETKSNWLRERVSTDRETLIAQLSVFAFIAINTFGIVKLTKRIRHLRQN